jgi:hypothetical protein
MKTPPTPEPDEMSSSARALAERLEDAGAPYEILDETIRSWATAREALDPGPLPRDVLGRLDVDAGELAAALGQPASALRSGVAHTDDLDRVIDRLVEAREAWESVRWLRTRRARWDRFPLDATLDGGAYRIIERVRGAPGRGFYRAICRSDGGRALVTTTTPHTRPLEERRRELAYRTGGVARLRHVGPLDGHGRDVVGLVEEEPAGVPSAELTLPMAPLDAARLAHQVAAALAGVHAGGAVIRFLRPELVYVVEGAGGGVELGGIVPRAEAFVAGATPCYGVAPLFDSVFAAPEVLAMAPAVGAAADVFSLAAVVGFWVTGEHPFEGHTPVAQLGAIASGRGRIWNGPVALGMVLADGLDPDPAARPALADLVRALERAAEQT